MERLKKMTLVVTMFVTVSLLVVYHLDVAPATTMPVRRSQSYEQSLPSTGYRTRDTIGVAASSNPQRKHVEQMQTYQQSLSPTVATQKDNIELVASTQQSGFGPYPEWWLKGWWASTATHLNHFVGDQPLIPSPCSEAEGTAQFDFVEPKSYIPTSKNPCWYQKRKAAGSKVKLRCLPYFYLAGVAKCGTSDLYIRMHKHPDLLYNSRKELHWWERGRFEEFEAKRPEFQDYVDLVMGSHYQGLADDLEERGSSNKIFGDFSPDHIFHNKYWRYIVGNEGCIEPRLLIGQHMRRVYPQAKIILTLRHPTTRLYSRFLSRIPRTPKLKGSDVHDFHNMVVEGVKAYRDCFERWSVRHCAYNISVYSEVQVRLQEGMYPVMLADWLRIWPRSQMHIMRYEDYGGHELERIQEIFDFLGMYRLNGSLVDAAMERDVVNSGSKEYEKYGAMLPETKKVLDDFYQPFTVQLAETLNDKRFLWLEYTQEQS